MATIYRFIVEQRTTTTTGGRKSSATTGGGATKGAAKKGRAVALFGGRKGGVEHNRKLRAVNPFLNKVTGGAAEKGMRLTRAGLGLVQVNSETGAFAGLSVTAITIILAFVLQSMLKWNAKERQKADQANTQNFKMLENGVGAIHGQYNVSADFWTGRLTYNQNK